MVSSYSRQNLIIRKCSFFDSPLTEDDSTHHKNATTALPSPSSSDTTALSTGTVESLSNDGSKNVVNQSLEECTYYHPCFELGVDGCDPYSALFKVRLCSECGCQCTKLEGYEKEWAEKKIETINLTPGTTTIVIEPPIKVYYHTWCSQLKEWRFEHSKKYSLVMHVLYVSHYRAVVNANRVREEAEADAPIIAESSQKMNTKKKKKHKQKHTLVKEQHQYQPLSRRPVVCPIIIHDFVKQIKRQSEIHESSNNSLPMVIDNWSETKGMERRQSDRKREQRERDVPQKRTSSRMMHKWKERVSSIRSAYTKKDENDDEDTLFLDSTDAVVATTKASTSVSVSSSSSNNSNNNSNNNRKTVPNKNKHTKQEQKASNSSRHMLRMKNRKKIVFFSNNKKTTTTKYDDKMNRVSKVVVDWSFPEP